MGLPEPVGACTTVSLCVSSKGIVARLISGNSSRYEAPVSGNCSRYVGSALVSGNSSAGVGFVVALLHSEARPFLAQVSPKPPSGVYRESF